MVRARTVNGLAATARAATAAWARRIFLAGLVLAAAACASSSDEGPVVTRAPEPTWEYEPLPPRPREPAGPPQTSDSDGYVTPPHLEGEEPARVALLLPFSAENASVRAAAKSMFNAAQLAAFEAGEANFVLLPKDTKGTADGARAAARAALSDGAELVIGPLYAQSVEAAAEVARAAGAPVIAFSTDVSVAGDGVFLLSFPPEIELARVTDYAMVKGMSRFGLIAPQSEYGERVSSKFAEEVFARGGVLVHEERYQQSPDAMLAPAKRLARYSREVVTAAPQPASSDPNDPDAERQPTGQTYGYQAVMIPESGTLLRALAPLLPYYDVDIRRIKLLGLSGWNDPRLAREPALAGGWFAAPDPEIVEKFDARYLRAFGEEPAHLASLAYDATALAAQLARYDGRDRFSAEAIADSNGHFGADGLFRFKPDGSIERGLAILEIQPGGIRVEDPAPRAFEPGY